MTPPRATEIDLGGDLVAGLAAVGLPRTTPPAVSRPA